MAKRSLKASEQGLEQLNQALVRNGQSKMALAEEVGVARSTVSLLFTGKSIQREIFSKICETLGLDWRDIAHIGEEEAESDIDALVQEVREKVKPLIQERCGTMRVLDMSQPIGLNDIYTDVNILEKITGRRRLEISELLQGFDPESEDFDRFGLSRVTEKRVPGLKAVEHYSKLMVLGKPGAGKTTFLKYLAIRCISGEFQAERVPIFITLKDFAETPAQPGLLEFITQMFANSGVTDTQITEVLKKGRALLFLDGLDEVKDEDSQQVLREIRYFSEQYYTNNFVITCRIAAQDYRFERFTDVELADVEVADFDDKQIQTFVTKWFKAKQLDLAERFMQQLNLNQPIRELTTSPLLLTLLCLVFEDSGNFPTNRSELYQEGIAILLRKWDATRRIERDHVYKKLSVHRKEDLLGQIALNTFEHADYFFKQRDVERYIADYIRNLPDAQTDPEALQLDSEVVLKSIEAQHGLLVERARGIYSFSHLTFQEYFTAREIVNTCNFHSLDDKLLHNLVNHITEKRWREVFLLIVESLPSADCLLLLIKQQIDVLVADDKKLQQLLMWANQKSLSVELPYQAAAIRAFYFAFAFDGYPRILTTGYNLTRFLNPILSHALDQAYAHDPIFDLNLAHALVLDLAFAYTYFKALRSNVEGNNFHDFFYIHTIKGTLSKICTLPLDPKLQQVLHQLKELIPDINSDKEILKQWYEDESQAWTEQLRAMMVEHRNIGQDWQFNEQHKKLLQQYYNANLLLLQCLNSDCYVSREVRSHIEDTLLLPIAEIEKRTYRD
ncbi:MAG: NACHT domain-containing NTPase [Symplocastrum torsivum CPER-KK1]|jgi:predicted NACHT family NTPase|uniref:NACHT domain-containing NTPase n=1 Tax=Symplocastrum torsivum CPER-KK1 TaxID=450513 RepID=A0A951PKP5_9CYAN|nr:NACHT domain-containing NTPase [Symplocastrum torsivum CPER-KK1]